MNLYVKIGEGKEEKFEPIQTVPSGNTLEIMVDYHFICKSVAGATPENIIAILNLAWSVKNVQDAVRRYGDAPRKE